MVPMRGESSSRPIKCDPRKLELPVTATICGREGVEVGEERPKSGESFVSDMSRLAIPPVAPREKPLNVRVRYPPPFSPKRAWISASQSENAGFPCEIRYARRGSMNQGLRVQKLGHYELADRLGIGGMAEVFSATHRSLGQVAMKLILPGLARDAEFADMFWDEARIASRLDHPHVVRVLDYGRVDGQLYMAMEYVDGPSLARALRKTAKARKPFSPGALLTIITQLLSALSYVHQARDEKGRALGIIHRDISPGNVMLTSSGQVKLGDFGIVRSQAVVRRTQPGELKGKIGYMAPEQALGEPVSPQSDLFSVGIILAEFLMLRPLFLGKTEMQTLTRTVEVDLNTWHRSNRHVPLALRSVVERALRPRPGDRFASAAQMREALLRIARAEGWAIDSREVMEELLSLELIAAENQQSGERLKVDYEPIDESDAMPTMIQRLAAGGRPTGRPVWNVDFTSRSLPERLFLAFRRARSGVIELSAGGASLVVELRDGHVHASYDSTGHAALGRLLVLEQLLTPAQLVHAIGESRRRKLRLGEYLVLTGQLRQQALARLLREQLAARLEPWSETTSGRLSVFAAPAVRSSAEAPGVPPCIPEFVTAMRPTWTETRLFEVLAPVWNAILLPADGSSVVEFGLTEPEVRALSTVLEGGAYEGRSVRAVIDGVVDERIARRREIMFALVVGLSAGLVQAPGFGS